MKKSEQKSDEDLLLLLKHDHAGAFEQLYKRYWAKLYASAYKKLKSKETAEEVIQDFFASIWLNRYKLDVSSSFSVYAYVSIKFLVFKTFRKEYLRQQHSAIVTEQIVDNQIEELLYAKEIEKAIKEGVNSLPERCRNVYELSRDHFKNNKEIAGLLGISEKTVENHLTKALRSLRLNIKDVISITIIILINNI